jgi:hypothetical protein
VTWQALIAVAAIAVAASLPGALLIWLASPRRVTDYLTFAFAATSLGLLGLGWVALVMAEAGIYSLARLALVWGIVVLALGILCLFAGRRRVSAASRQAVGRRIHRWEAAALGAWLLLVCVLYFRPHQTVLGGADVGVYINLGAHIARTGRILISDPTLAALDPGLDAAFLRALPPSEGAPYYLLPGFYVPGTERGLVVPQFYPLHPVWLAVAHSLGGLQAALLLTPLWAVLGAFAVYMTVRRLWGWKVGLLALAALSLAAMQVWFARYATAEMLTQFLFWTGGWALIGWVDDEEPHWLWSTLAGVALGMVFLTRIDMYVLLAVPIVAAIWRWRTHTYRRADALFFGPFILLALHSLLHGALQSGPYTAGLFRYIPMVISYWLKPLAVVGAAVIGSAAFLAFIARRRGFALGPRIRRWPWGWLAALGVIGLALYGYFLRPSLGQTTSYAYWYGGGQLPNLDHENLLRLGWYLSPLGVGLSVIGAAWMLIKEANRRTAFVLGAGVFFSLFYLWRIQANPHQIYAMRRYVPVVLPFFVVAGAYAIHRLSTLRPPWARGLGLGLTLLWILSIVGSARGFVSQVDLRSAIDQMDRLNALFLPRSVLLFGDPAPVGMGDLLGTPLRFLHGHDVYTVRDLNALDPARFTEALARWQAEDRAIYWIDVQNGFGWPGGASLGAAQEFTFEAAVLENTYDHKPSRIDVTPWRITVAPVMAVQP